VFVIYAVVIGVAVGYLLGGRLDALAGMRLRWPWVAIAGLAFQVVLFSGALDDQLGGAGPLLYVVSTAVVLAVVLANVRVPGLALVAAGATSNLAAILANGGYMPADPGALALAGLEPDGGFSNSVVTDAPALRPLTDIFALPDAVPLANVFSVGDVLIALGIAIAIAAGMRRTTRQRTAPHVVRAGNSPD
jgi:Family of unknown function (DUF5317)